MSESQTASADAAIIDAARILQQLERTDLAQRVSAAAARLRRPATVVCVVGEFKQGKSSLINALLGQNVCPVDDDLATSAITLVRWSEEPSATVRRRVPRTGTAATTTPGTDPEATELVVEAVPITDLHQWVSEAGNPGNHKGVDRVEITAPSALLKSGLVIVDTPGMGGLGAGHAAATLGFLPFADGLLFVSDASAELAAPEIEFLRRARELCPTVLFAQTKIDLYPQWQRIIDINRGHLSGADLDVPIVGVSSALRLEALRRKDRDLNDSSRVPELIAHLGSDVVEPARANALGRSVGEASGALAQVAAGLRAEATLLADPAAAAEGLAALEAAKSRLEFLRGPAAKWNVLVGDRVADLSNQVNHRFRGTFRTISKMMDERIEVLAKGNEWDELTDYLQKVVADEVTDCFIELEQGRTAIRAEVVELLRDEELGTVSKSQLVAPIDVAQVWQSKALEPQTSGGRKAFGTVITGARGAQGGIIMFGMMGTFLPAAAGVLIASNPVLLGIGAVFGGMGLADDRRRKVAARRVAARTQVRQFLDDISFEMGNETGAVVRDIQRELRDDFSERIGELIRTCAETAQRAQADMQRTTAERTQRGERVAQFLAAIDEVDRRLAASSAAAS